MSRPKWTRSQNHALADMARAVSPTVALGATTSYVSILPAILRTEYPAGRMDT